MGLVLKHVVVAKAGTLHYRRRLPKNTIPIVGKGEFKRLLGSTERETVIATTATALMSTMEDVDFAAARKRAARLWKERSA